MAMVTCSKCGNKIHHTARVCPRCGASQQGHSTDNGRATSNESTAISADYTRASLKKKLYSPLQIEIGTFFGGPLAGMYYLKSNFDALSKFNESKLTVIASILFCIALIAVLDFLPARVDGVLVSLIYLIPVLWIIQKYQLTKKTIQESEKYDFQSNWKVFGMSITWMLVLIISAAIIMNIIKPNEGVYFLKGQYYQNRGQYQHAIDNYNEAIRLKPSYPMAYFNRGSSYVKLGQNQLALEDLNESIRLKHDFIEAFILRGGVYMLQGSYELGCRDEQKACELGNCKWLEEAKSRGLCR